MHGPKRIRVVLAWSLALCLHALLFLLPCPEAPKRKALTATPKATRVRWVRAVHQKSETTPKPLIKSKARKAPKVSHHAKASSEENGKAKSTEAQKTVADAVAPTSVTTPAADPGKSVELFPKGIAVPLRQGKGHGVDKVVGPTASEVFDERMRSWVLAHKEAENAMHGRASQALREHGQRLWGWFSPPPASLERAAKFRLGFGSGLASELEYYSSGRANTPSKAIQQKFERHGRGNPLGKGGLELPKTLACFGQCSDVGNAVARLGAKVRVYFLRSGEMERWEILESSGDVDFDDSIQSSLETTLQDCQRPSETPLSGCLDKETLYADWLFRGVVYRYSRDQLLTDPSFIPSGRRLDEFSSILGEVYLDREVRLVGLVLRQ